MEGARKEPGLIRICIAAALCILSAASEAQGRPELRADAIITKSVAVYAGGGVLFPLGTYVRSGVMAGAGIVDGSGTFHADFLNLFHLDPFRESSWGPYAGGGLSFRHDTDDGSNRTNLLAVIGIEGPRRAGRATAFEVGLGGGVRIALILRKAGPRTR